MQNFLKLFTLFGLTILLNGCLVTTQTGTTTPPVYTKYGEDLQPQVVNPTKGQMLRKIELSPYSSSATFTQGEAIELSFSYVDWNTYSLQTELLPETNQIRLSLLNIDNDAVVLKKKCDIINISGVAELPRIKVAADLNLEQVVITPTFDNECNKNGYQIRYGSVESGCKEGVSVLRDLKRCTGEIKAVAGERKVVRKRTPCPEYLLFGTPCP